MPNAGERDEGRVVRSWDPLTSAEVAAILKVPVRRVRELGIPCVQLGPKTVRYLRDELEEWLRKKRVGGFADGRRR